MLDGFTDFAIGYCDHDVGRPSLGRLIPKIIVAYLLITAMFLTESQFRKHGIDLEARVETIGETKLQGKCAGTGLLVRYHFRDPVTGQPRMNTVALPRHLAPTTQMATIEYIPGEYPTSRLKVQQRPIIFSIYFWINAIFMTVIIGLIGCVAWQAHHPIPRSSERRVRLKRC
jgi:hypothetical protein